MCLPSLLYFILRTRLRNNCNSDCIVVPPSDVARDEGIVFTGLLSGRCPLSVNTCSACRSISVLSGRISTKLGTNIRHLI